MPQTSNIGACECCGGCSCANCEISQFLDEDSKEPCTPDGTSFSIFQGYGKIGIVAGSSGPTGVQYADGYPEELGNCDWFWWRGSNYCTVASASLGFPGAYSYVTTQWEKWILYRCEDGVLTDITDTATTNGPFEYFQLFGGNATGGESAACGGIPCPNDPDQDYLVPTIDCNEFP
jgi:hypothetical protein